MGVGHALGALPTQAFLRAEESCAVRKTDDSGSRRNHRNGHSYGKVWSCGCWEKVNSNRLVDVSVWGECIETITISATYLLLPLMMHCKSSMGYIAISGCFAETGITQRVEADSSTG
ncbi:hypothetical protein PMIN06_000932 [Paraphaeosphaeria minitans]